MSAPRRTIAALAAAALLLAAADTGLAAHAEHGFAGRLGEDVALPGEPWVGLGGAAYASSLVTGRWSSIKVRARDVAVPGLGLVTVESGAVNARVPASAVFTGDFERTATKKFFTSVQLDAVALGGLLGVDDLLIQNLEDISPAGGWETEAILRATPPGAAGPATVAVKLRIRDGVVLLLPYEVIDAPAGAAASATLDAFRLTLGPGRLPLGGRPTRIYVSGGSIHVESERLHTTVTPADFLPLADAGRGDGAPAPGR
ncbi:LmeA family phospholipid-binding protein [Corynebacterium sphenisci]|uniref:LmeA family phospholipid-binding protein n=1 Tax=Corynebacterium sphenisci TaxID=191493 RepID=UPI0026E05F61|nr:DUF2993 domain-containing protein [Corynebacterium sphenisci]MDO5730185.1 DUF2993 domain-containing protein [Corynebacterium sphenisci]